MCTRLGVMLHVYYQSIVHEQPHASPTKPAMASIASSFRSDLDPSVKVFGGRKETQELATQHVRLRGEQEECVLRALKVWSNSMMVAPRV